MPALRPFFPKLADAARAAVLGLFALAGLAGRGPVSAEETAAPSSKEVLVPAAFGIWTDRTGNSWSVEAAGNIGRIGSALVNSGLALQVNDEKFEAQRPMMTADGKELVLPGAPMPSLPGLEVQRRVRLLEASGGLRYAELLHNGSTDPLSVTVALTTHFSGNYKTFLSDRGRSEPVLLEGDETSVLVLPGSAQSSRAFLFTLTDGVSGVRPSLSAQNRYGLAFRYSVDLAPGESAVVAHTVAQVVIPRSFDRPTLAQLARPYSLAEVRGTFPADWKGLVVNAVPTAAESPAVAWRRGGLAKLGLTPGAFDLLAMGEQSRLSGAASGGPIRLDGPYGEAEFPLETLAALSGEKGGLRRFGRVYLKDGQVFSGRLEASGLTFAPTEGSQLELDPATLDRLVFAAPAPAEPVWPAGVAAVFETLDGDRIHLPEGKGGTFDLATAWGILTLSIDQLLWLRPDGEGGPGHVADLADGTRVRGLIDAEGLPKLSLGTEEFQLATTRLGSVFTPKSSEVGGGAGPVPAGTAVRLVGDNQLVGRIANTAIQLHAEGNAVETPIAEIRRLERTAAVAGNPGERVGEAPVFRVERWDGGVLTGFLGNESLSLEVAGNIWQIPVIDLVAVEAAAPTVEGETLTKIEALIRNLGSDDWSTREQATRELGAFGYLAQPVLKRELHKAADPEVGRRLARVLSELN